MVMSELTWKVTGGDLLDFYGTGDKGAIVTLTNKEILIFSMSWQFVSARADIYLIFWNAM